MEFYAAIESDDMEGLTMFPFGLYAGYILYKKTTCKTPSIGAASTSGQKHIGNKPSTTNPPAWPSVLNLPAATFSDTFAFHFQNQAGLHYFVS